MEQKQYFRMKHRTMKQTLLLFCLFTAGLTFAQFKVVGYLPTWSAIYPTGMTAAHLDELTHLNIAFANPDANGTLIPADGTNADVHAAVLDGHAHNLKVLLSIGGGGADGTNYHQLITTDVTAFADSIVSYTLQQGLDGIDVDIEGDILDGTILTASQYETFVTELGNALHAQNKLMTCALGTWFGNLVTNTAASRFDWINVMSYDATGPWDPGNPGQHSPFSMAVSDFQYWNTTKAVPAGKLTVGVPFYGYGFGTYANQGIAFCDIVNTYPGSASNDQVGSGGDAIYYNGIPTIQQKTTYALEHAGGIMIWELSQDCAGEPSLLSVIDSVVTAYGLTGIPENEQPDDVTIWPNPTRGMVSILFPATTEPVQLKLLTLAGTDLTAGLVTTVSTATIALDLNGLPDGVYLLALTSRNQRTVRRIVIRH